MGKYTKPTCERCHKKVEIGCRGYGYNYICYICYGYLKEKEENIKESPEFPDGEFPTGYEYNPNRL